MSATLPAAKRTGKLTIVTDSIVEVIDYDEKTGKAAGVTIIDTHTKEKRSYQARVVFLCASALGSVQILLNSRSPQFPKGIANSSGTVGHYIMDHFELKIDEQVKPIYFLGKEAELESTWCREVSLSILI